MTEPDPDPRYDDHAVTPRYDTRAEKNADPAAFEQGGGEQIANTEGETVSTEQDSGPEE